MKRLSVKINNNNKSPCFKTHGCIDWIFYTYSGTHFLPPTPHSVFWHFLTLVRLNIPSHVLICTISTYPPYLPASSITTEHVTYNNGFFPPMEQQPPSGPCPPHCRSFTNTNSHTTLGRIPLDEGSDRRRDLYATAHNTHNRQASMHPAVFEPAIPTSEQPQT
jgi:hypothetical protein